jgi:hypothetical protein
MKTLTITDTRKNLGRWFAAADDLFVSLWGNHAEIKALPSGRYR